MKITLQLVAIFVLTLLSSSCVTRKSESRFVRQKIPIEIQKSQPANIEIRSLGGGRENRVAIQCSPEIWNALTNGTKQIAVQLVSSTKPVQISGILLGNGPSESLHYLFSIWGDYHARASVQITFPNAPEGVTHADILIYRTLHDANL